MNPTGYLSRRAEVVFKVITTLSKTPINSEQQRRCLYCSALKDPQEFNREHVVPRALGTFEDGQARLDSVCQTCNKSLGDKLIGPTMGTSIIGLIRSLKTKSNMKAGGQKSLIDISTTNSGWVAGVKFEYCPRWVALVMRRASPSTHCNLVSPQHQ